MKIHDYIPEALIQRCEAEKDENGEWEPKGCCLVEDMDGTTALKEIREALSVGCDPVVVNGKIMGYITSTGTPWIYCDCDECTYEEYYGEPYQG